MRFFFRKSDRIALSVLCLVLLGLLLYVYSDVSPYRQTGVTSRDKGEDKERKSEWGAARNNRYPFSKARFYRDRQIIYRVEGKAAERFPFDPNHADSTQLLRLGLSPWQVRAIYRYRALGGVYRRVADFAKVPGLTAGQYAQLKPYVRIGSDAQPASELPEVKAIALRDSLRRLGRIAKLSAGEHVDLNAADTAAFKRVPGIGSYYASRIVSYGNSLGGYVSVNQLDEIDGFPPEAKPFFVIGNASTRPLLINRLSLKQLLRHPYLNFFQARDIVDYRKVHGTIRQLDDLASSPNFPAEAIERLRPYVAY